MKFKKLTALAIASIMALSVVGCTSQPKEEKEEKSTLTEAGTINEDKFIVGTSADYPPYEFKKNIDGKDEFVGFDIELAKAIAADLGKELEIVEMSFKSLLLELDTGKVDMVISGLSPTPDRAEQAELSDIYYNATHAVITLEENATKYTDLESLKGATVGVQMGSIQEAMAKEQMTEVEIVSLDKIPSVILELTTGKIDVAVIEKPVAQSFMAQKPEIKFAFGMEDDEGGNVVATKKGNTKLMESANATIAKVVEDGTFDQWVVDAIALSEAE